MSSKTVMAKSSLWSFTGQTATKLFSFIYTVLIARLLLPEDIGAFYLALSVISVLFIFTDFGIDYALGRYVPYLFGRKEYAKLRFLAKVGYFGGGLLTIVFAVFVFLFSDNLAGLINSPEIAPLIRIFSVYLVINEVFIVNNGILRGRKRIKEIAVINFIQSIAKLVLTVLVIYSFGANSAALATSFLLSFAIVTPLGIYWAWNEIKALPPESTALVLDDKIAFSKEVLHFGLVTSVIVALVAVVQYTDRIMLGYFEVPLSEIGVYSIALGLANLVLLFPSSINTIFLPVVSELYGREEKNEMLSVVKTAIKWVIFTMLPIVLIMTVFSDNLLRMFYGETYGPGWIVFTLFTVGLFIQSIFSICGNTLVAMRRLDIQFRIVLVAAVLNILLNIYMIPAWGINGAALASFISLCASSLLVAYQSEKVFAFKFPTEAYKPIVAGLLALAILFLFKEYILVLVDAAVANIQIGLSSGQLVDEIVQKLVKLIIFGLLFLLSAVVYFIALLLLKSFGEEEISLLEAGLRKARIPEKYISLSRAFLEARWLPFHK